MRVSTVLSTMLPIGAALAAVIPTGTVLPLTALLPEATSAAGIATSNFPENVQIVLVGDTNNNPVFFPSNVTAVSGDTIAFGFTSGNHTVTQSSFADPCTTLPSPSFDSGFVSASVTEAASQVEVFLVNITDANVGQPLWFYSRGEGDCHAGMVFAVNPTADKTFAAFQAAAKKTKSNSAGPIEVFGTAGVLLTGLGVLAGLTL
ncbi:hypothetical protein EW026_g7155 [Hermanssonia centrifuga]|uniref:Uncharacterized protein n=1 Tax=Hermanssonia centrifuga TaxID=98765 RepID=A0A4S4K8Q8_9APHY|nr:hypothetical protein EW026_g7155 [Hermanssonia centrifuga]